MQPFRGDNIAKSEWRWVTFWGGLLVIITLIPYVWATFASSDNWFFPGILSAPVDGVPYLSKIRDGIQGKWLVELRYTPTAHEPAAMFPFYTALGHIARTFGFSSIIVFHLARLATSLFMFAALYQLGATVWRRLRPRRLFFWMAAMGSGMGWLLISLKTDFVTPDIAFPEAFPFYAAFTNPHYPLSFGLMALLAAQYLQVYRPGFIAVPTADNGGMNIIIYTILLAVIQPSTLLVLGGTLTLYVLLATYQKRAIPWHEIRWFSMLFLPATPFLFYYLTIFSTNDTYAEFNAQYVSDPPNLALVFLGYGFLIVIATPGIARTLSRFSRDRDGDQLMLLWLIFNVVALYLPYGLQRRLFIGLTIPIVYFAVRAIEDYWLDRIPQRWHITAIIGMFVSILPTNLLVLILPLFIVANPSTSAETSGLLIESSYEEALIWLDDNGVEGEVVLAAPASSLWIPAQTDLRVVYGHIYETVPAAERLEQVEAFFMGDDCVTLLDDASDFKVAYVLWGPREADLIGENPRTLEIARAEACQGKIANLANLTLEFGDGEVKLYVLRELR